MLAPGIAGYTVVIRVDDSGTFVAHAPALDGCHAWGKTAAGARARLDDVFTMIVEEHAEAGRPLPPDINA